jgi:phosphoserine aminotransferase
MLTLRWLKENGGVEAIEKLNNQKSALLYDTIDNSKIFKGTVVKEDRSKMNVCFVMEDPEKEKAFLEFAKQNNIYGIKGHRSVGGFRASLYNALPLNSVQFLADRMKEFESMG